MNASDGFEYAQARLQARLARLPGDALWLRLAAQKGLAAYLEAARSTSLGPWIADISPDSDAHAIDRSVSGHLDASIHEVARWVPEPWAAAVRWVHWLPRLPELTQAGPMPDSPAPGPVAPRATAAAKTPAGDESARGRMLAELRPLSGESPRQVWLRSWQKHLPGCGEECAAAFASLLETLQRHLQEFPKLPPARTWDSRRALAEKLRLSFRRHPGAPVLAFIYLALVALALEKLRADLIRRALFPLPEHNP